MFKLKKSRGPVRFLLQQALHNNNQHRLLMAYLAGCDPCSCNSKAFSPHQSLSSDRGGSNGVGLLFPFLRKLAYDNVIQLNKSVGFNLRGCSDINGHGNNFSFKTKDRAFASFPRPPLLADLEDTPVREDGRDASLFKIDNRSLNGSPTKPLSIPNHNLSQKIVVAVDVDEVLGNFVSALNRFIADRYLSNYSVSEYHVYEFFKIWNCSRDEADLRVHEFFETPYFKSGIHPLPGAQTALQKLSRFCSLSVVTSRQNVIKNHTIEWLEKNFPGLFQEIHFGNHFALDGVSRPKSEICRSLGAKVLIDDNPRYAIECAEAGIEVLLFDYENSYPWSKSESVDQHPLVTRVKNWEEVEQQLMSSVAS
ncbi:hypothetical protein L6164_011873 [Bauhinia variegata]|uniref:Uncharacterized protein n=1 Tax=Bauhinia variegata TaxID=167791 RepID=A0ACB9P9Q5_BAUVA|nr:hypothetical protein L6164_011873 [Bauhinia variegata]